MEPTTRGEARALGFDRYFTGKPCKRGHIVDRYVTGACVVCSRERVLAWDNANRDKARARIRKHIDSDRDAYLKKRAEYYRMNCDALRVQSERWRAENKQRLLASVRAWRKRNPASRAAQTSARHARKLNATPKWADLAAIRAIYARCAEITASTGVPHHVDHIVPLRGKNVSGLHVPLNLRIIPAAENLAKSNRFCESLVA